MSWELLGSCYIKVLAPELPNRVGFLSKAPKLEGAQDYIEILTILYSGKIHYEDIFFGENAFEENTFKEFAFGENTYFRSLTYVAEKI